MSLGIPISVVKKEGYDLILYSNPPYGYYIKKYSYTTKLTSKLSSCIKDYDEAVEKFEKIVGEN